MYLKTIEVQGFKSFANKIVFEFHNGITGIVGPNGSGKSNVGDAVRWVLGEQSAKQLRGSNMQDVIFSGTENRKPLGYAYVSITLDNSDHKLSIDFEEVTVARKVFRSGESEYLINGSVCRLKDVQELFYDTGIGKEGYSLIGQGQIDKIISGKAEERRELFDEAAGIVKFKKRKKAAERNLQNERANLLRINDILSELEKQVGPLEKQSEKAKIYLKKREELKTYDVNMFLIETSQVKDQLKVVEDRIQIVGEDLRETKDQYEETKTAYEELQNNIKKVENQMEEARNVLSQASVSSQRLEGEINVLKEQIRSTEDVALRIEDRRQAVIAEMGNKNEEQKRLDEEYFLLSEQLDSIRHNNDDDQNRLATIQKSIQNYNIKMEDAKNHIIQFLNEKAATQGKQQRYDTMLEQVQIRRSELNQKILTLKSSEKEHQLAFIKHQEELKVLSDKLTELLEKEEQLKSAQEKWEKLQKQKSARRQELQNSYHREQSRLDSLINMTERYDGYSNAIRRVMEQKENNQGLIGVVADIIKTEKQYETAIETALGGTIQNIVTDTEQTAKTMIVYLKRNHYGRATFLPLNSIHTSGSGIREEAIREPGALGVASNLVQAKQQYDGLLSYLLGRTLVVDTMDHAISIARKYRHSIRIVTLEGELLNPGGSMTGGAFKNNSNLLGRRREIEELTEKTIGIREMTDQLSQEIQNLEKELVLNQQQKKELSVQIQEAYLAQNTVKMNVNQSSERMAEVTENYRRLQKEGAEMEEQMQSIGYQKKQINEEVMLIQNKVEALHEQIDAWQIDLLEEQEYEEELTSRLSKKQMDQAGLQQKQDNIRQNRKRTEEEVRRYQQELKQLENENQQIVTEARQKEEKIRQTQEAYAASEEEKKSSRKLLTDLSEKKETFANDNRGFLERRESLLERKNDLDKESARLEGQKERLEEAYETSVNYMWEEYELTYSEACSLKDEQYSDGSNLKQRIRQIRDEIRKLGDVNVNAIEDYKVVSERYEFLNAQRNDLLEAEQTLMNIIEELEKGMKRQFKEKFEEIKKEFDKVFKELFGGGKGTLELDEEEDILEAGIKINSQPPGKKLGNMMQLSGGEKALTAISLLFAIQNLKPSPFCLLDEIEAALDDSNVTRYAKYLHRLTKHTQFIIITHRRGTMAAADRLYGITMQEKGVSTLVSVNLIEEELEK